MAARKKSEPKPDTGSVIVVQFCGGGCQKENWLRMSAAQSREMRPFWTCARCMKEKK